VRKKKVDVTIPDCDWETNKEKKSQLLQRPWKGGDTVPRNCGGEIGGIGEQRVPSNKNCLGRFQYKEKGRGTRKKERHSP